MSVLFVGLTFFSSFDYALAIVDSGLVKETHWEPVKSTVLTVPISKTSATQRMGRAGRVAVGMCYRLYTMGQYEAMPERPVPEIQRSALEATCLNAYSMTNDKVTTFLSRALDPPAEKAVAYSIESLKKLGAIDSSSTALTPLGHCLSHLPLDPRIGRMLIMGCVLQCLDPILTAAACFSSREVFFTPPGLREEQRISRQEFCQYSDTLATVRAYEEYNDVLDEGWDVATQWASDNFISISAIASVHSIRMSLVDDLQRIGLIHSSDLEQSRGKHKKLRLDANVNRNAGIESLYSSVWVFGAPDNLAVRQKLGSFGALRTRTEDRTGLHPSSVAFHGKTPMHSHRLPPWYSYNEMVLSSHVFLRGCTALTPERILLFGGFSFDRSQHLIDDWIMVEGQCAETLSVLSDARREINSALEWTAMNPRKPLPEVQRSIIDAVCDCFNLLDENEK
jgi:ATP-dependent RNA helicase DHX36